MSYSHFWRPYVPVHERRQNAAREMEKLGKKGHRVSPVVIQGRNIANTFWGKAWCDNLERYSDFSNRIPRGRTYVRNGSVVDLQLAPGEADARVSGSSLYKVNVKIAPVKPAQWQQICRDCAGGIDSLVELLQGRFSKAVMERVCEPGKGLFPASSEIKFECSCPDWASMCKHVAAVLYGIGARLDEQPELLFRLRKVDETELIAHAGKGVPLSVKGPAAEKVLEGTEVADLFGLEMAQAAEPEGEPYAKAKKPKRATAKAAASLEKPARASRAKALDGKRSVGRRGLQVTAEPAAPPIDGGRKGTRRAIVEPEAFCIGQLVQYRQGRGSFPARVVSVERDTLGLERVIDGKKVARPTSKVTAK
jgi:uncharacterized Zn finger protein